MVAKDQDHFQVCRLSAESWVLRGDPWHGNLVLPLAGMKVLAIVMGAGFVRPWKTWVKTEVLQMELRVGLWVWLEDPHLSALSPSDGLRLKSVIRLRGESVRNDSFVALGCDVFAVRIRLQLRCLLR